MNIISKLTKTNSIPRININETIELKNEDEKMIDADELNEIKISKKNHHEIQDEHIYNMKQPKHVKKIQLDNFSSEDENVIDDEKVKKQFENIIIYVHGGAGFAGNSHDKQHILRPMAKKIKIPVFSFDYRKIPSVTYPTNYNDMINAYLWIINFIENILGVKIKKLILSGDSYGGLGAIFLTNWCIWNGFR